MFIKVNGDILNVLHISEIRDTDYGSRIFMSNGNELHVPESTAIIMTRIQEVTDDIGGNMGMHSP